MSNISVQATYNSSVIMATSTMMQLTGLLLCFKAQRAAWRSSTATPSFGEIGIIVFLGTLSRALSRRHT